MRTKPNDESESDPCPSGNVDLAAAPTDVAAWICGVSAAAVDSWRGQIPEGTGIWFWLPGRRAVRWRMPWLITWRARTLANKAAGLDPNHRTLEQEQLDTYRWRELRLEQAQGRRRKGRGKKTPPIEPDVDTSNDQDPPAAQDPPAI